MRAGCSGGVGSHQARVGAFRPARLSGSCRSREEREQGLYGERGRRRRRRRSSRLKRWACARADACPTSWLIGRSTACVRGRAHERVNGLCPGTWLVPEIVARVGRGSCPRFGLLGRCAECPKSWFAWAVAGVRGRDLRGVRGRRAGHVRAFDVMPSSAGHVCGPTPRPCRGPGPWCFTIARRSITDRQRGEYVLRCPELAPGSGLWGRDLGHGLRGAEVRLWVGAPGLGSGGWGW